MAKRVRKARRKLLSGRRPIGDPPAGMTKERWKKLWENTTRAERMTGVAVLSAEGWEIVAVLLMDQIDVLRAKPKP